MNDLFTVFIGLFLLAVVFMILLLGFSWWWIRRKKPSLPLSPYTGTPLRKATEISFDAKMRVYQFMDQFKDFDNRMFSFEKSAICRETGRIFPNCVNWWGKIQVDWTFLQKRFFAHYVSWGSLSSDAQRDVREMHDSLVGFQTEVSSLKPSPKEIELNYIYAKPGPLYVDPTSNILLGWQSVPGTELEVLILQKPLKKII